MTVSFENALLLECDGATRLTRAVERPIDARVEGKRGREGMKRVGKKQMKE